MVAGFVVLGPLVGWVLATNAASSLRGLGFGALVDNFDGSRPFTDIGWEVAGARGLVDALHSLYDTPDVLGPLIGMNAYPYGIQTHPPTAAVPWIPLAHVPYGWWLPFITAAAVAAIAVSMRVMRVPAWIAYPTTVVIALTAVGQFSLTTTYPLTALLIACAWRYRNRPWIAGPAYGLFAATRGIGVLLLLYPLIRRQFRTFAIGIGVVVILGLIAIALEPHVVGDFLDRGTESISEFSAGGYPYSPQAILSRRGLPGWLAWLVAGVVAVCAARFRGNLFWGLTWLVFALSALAWAWTAIATIPLIAAIGMSGRSGRVVAILTGGVALGVLAAAPVGANVLWPFVLTMTAVGILAFRLEDAADDVNREPEGAIAVGFS